MSIKSIKEKELLVNLAKSFGQEVDASLVEEVKEINKLKNKVKESVKTNLFKDLSEAFKKAEEPKYEIAQLPVLETLFPKPPSLDDLSFLLDETPLTEEKDELVQKIQTKEPAISEDTKRSDPQATIAQSPEVIESKPSTLADATVKFLTDSKDSFQQPDPLEVEPNIDALVKKVRFLEQWIAKVSMAGPGSGETKLRFLDDIDRDSIADNKFLRYNASKAKFDFTDAGARVVTDDNPPANPQDGDLWYNTAEAVMYIWLEENGSGQWIDTGDGSGRNLISTRLVNFTPYTIIDSDSYIGVNVTSTANIILPNTSTAGRVLMIKDESGNCINNPINIIGQVDNDPGGATLQINNGTLQLVYRSGWRIV